MKLYTEEQVKILLDALIDIKNWDEELEDEWEDCGYRAIEAINEFADKEPIQLPSDEEIEGKSRNHCNIKQDLIIDHEERYYKDFQKYDAFIDGAKWIKEQLKNNQNG